MSRIQLFIKAINDHFLEGKKLNEINDLWKQMNEYSICKEEVKTGKRQGESCGKACIKGKDTCLFHIPRVSKNKNECQFTLIAGKNKGNKCLKKCVNEFCKNHSIEKNPCIFMKNGKECGVNCKTGILCKRHLKINNKKEE
jgi:hypothetical protein